MNSGTIYSIRITDIFRRQHPQLLANIEQASLKKEGKNYGSDTGMISDPVKEISLWTERFYITVCRRRLLVADVMIEFTDSG